MKTIINKKKGFTLIELLVVIAIIGIITSIVLSNLNTARNKAVSARNAEIVFQYANAMALCIDNNKGQYPTTAGGQSITTATNRVACVDNGGQACVYFSGTGASVINADIDCGGGKKLKDFFPAASAYIDNSDSSIFGKVAHAATKALTPQSVTTPGGTLSGLFYYFDTDLKLGIMVFPDTRSSGNFKAWVADTRVPITGTTPGGSSS